MESKYLHNNKFCPPPKNQIHLHNSTETYSKYTKFLMYHAYKFKLQKRFVHRSLSEIIVYTVGSLVFLKKSLGNSMGQQKWGLTTGKEHFLTMKSHIKATLNGTKRGSNSVRKTEYKIFPNFWFSKVSITIATHHFYTTLTFPSKGYTMKHISA